MSPFQHVGFVGLGKMGGTIATRMVGNVPKLTVFDTQPAAVARLVDEASG